jgi:sec-independent protein translocase protein TatA
MGPIGYPEIIVILMILLLLFGAKRIPELARGIGKSIAELKKARHELSNEVSPTKTDLRDMVKPVDRRSDT